MTYVQIFVNKW